MDVFSFGVVVLELTTGKVAANDPNDLTLAGWARQQFHEGRQLSEVVDQHIPDLDNNLQAIISVFSLGLSCTLEDPKVRPTMKDALYQLERDSGMVSQPVVHRVPTNNVDITIFARERSRSI